MLGGKHLKNLLKALKLCIKEHGKGLDDRDIFAATAMLQYRDKAK